jgi:signal peptidase I
MKLNKFVFKLLCKLKIGEKCLVHVPSDSMWPLIDINDQLIIQKTNIGNINKYDVIVFYSNEFKKLIVHRITNIKKIDNNIQLTTKGDNNPQKDKEFIKKENLLGKVIWIKNKKIRLDKYNYSWLSFSLNNEIFRKIKQKLFYFIYNSRF